jgi:hypothetical protein
MIIMRNYIILVIVVFLTSCSTKVIKETPLDYTFMPKYLDIDSIKPFVLDDTNRVIDSSYTDFVSIPIDGGKLIGVGKDTLKIPAGVLISERKAALYTFYIASWERQQKELRYTKYLMSEYYSKAKAAETLYQSEIVRLEKKAERSWLERNMAYIGFGSGLATAIITAYVLFGGTNLIK